jgi:tetratricopeptide (TPR) repeat protein
VNRETQRLYSFALNRTGDAQMRSGQYGDALKVYSDSVAIRRRLAETEPRTPQARDDLAAALEKLGEAQHSLGGGTNDRDAAQSFDDSLTIRKGLVAEDPNNGSWRRNLGLSYEHRGKLLIDFSREDEAIESFKSNLALRRQLAIENPEDTQARRDLANAHDFVGLGLQRLGRIDEAISAYIRSRDLRKALADSDPKNLEWSRDLAVGFAHCGDAYLNNGNKAAALDQYQAAQSIRTRLVASDSANPQWQSDLALDFRRLGVAGEESRANFERALRIASELAKTKKLAAEYKDLIQDLEARLKTITP